MSQPVVTAEMALRWAGVVLVVFSALFFVSTAISRGWIGPEVQLGLATLGGAGLVATGVHLDRRWGGERRPWSLALTNAGVVVLALCAGAAHGWLDLVGAGAASALIVVVLALAVVLADRFDHESLAISGLASALIVPGLVGVYDEFGDLGTGAWLLFLVAVTMALAGRYRWSAPRLLGLVVIGPLMVVMTQDLADPVGSDRPIVQIMIAVAGVLWWLAPWLRPAGQQLRSLDQRLVFIVPGLVWMASFGLWAETDRQRAVLAIVVAAGFGALTGLIRLAAHGWRSATRFPDELLFGQIVGVGSLVSAALALWFDGPTLLAALTVQALGTIVLALRADDRLLEANAALLSAIVGAWTAVGLLEGVEDGLDPAHGAVHLLVLAAAGVAAWLVHRRSLPAAGLAAVLGWVGLLTWFMAVLRPLPQGQMIVSMVWAVLGVMLVVVGLGALDIDRPLWFDSSDRWRNQIKSVGLATLAATVVKLVTIDLAEVDTIWRALLFAVVGLGLLRLGYRIGVLERSETADATRPDGVAEDGAPTP